MPQGTPVPSHVPLCVRVPPKGGAVGKLPGYTRRRPHVKGPARSGASGVLVVLLVAVIRPIKGPARQIAPPWVGSSVLCAGPRRFRAAQPDVARRSIHDGRRRRAWLIMVGGGQKKQGN